MFRLETSCRLALESATGTASHHSFVLPRCDLGWRWHCKFRNQWNDQWRKYPFPGREWLFIDWGYNSGFWASRWIVTSAGLFVPAHWRRRRQWRCFAGWRSPGLQGGNGGAAVVIAAAGNITINGIINVSGSAGPRPRLRVGRAVPSGWPPCSRKASETSLPTVVTTARRGQSKSRRFCRTRLRWQRSPGQPPPSPSVATRRCSRSPAICPRLP